MKKNELSYKQLKDCCNPSMFRFETTNDIEDTDIVYGQDRGIKALQFGLSVDSKGYNLYVEGPSGVGKTLYTKQYVNSIAAKKKTPDDWCYIYNFDNPNEKNLLFSGGTGLGKTFLSNCIVAELLAARKNCVISNSTCYARYLNK